MYIPSNCTSLLYEKKKQKNITGKTDGNGKCPRSIFQ